MAIKVIVLDVHRVRVFTNRHAPIIRVVSIAEKVKTRVVSVPRVLVQACRAAHHSPEENMVSHAVAAIVLVPVIIKEEKKAAISPVSRAAIALVHNMVSSVVAISLAVVISPVSRVAISLAAAISPVAVISHVLNMVSLVRENRVVISPVVATSLVRAVISLMAVISPVSRVVMLPSVVASRSSVAAMIPMPSIR